MEIASLRGVTEGVRCLKLVPPKDGLSLDVSSFSSPASKPLFPRTSPTTTTTRPTNSENEGQSEGEGEASNQHHPSPDLGLVWVAGRSGGWMHVMDAQSRERIHSMKSGSDNQVSCMSLVGPEMWVGMGSGEVCIYNAESGAFVDKVRRFKSPGGVLDMISLVSLVPPSSTRSSSLRGSVWLAGADWIIRVVSVSSRKERAALSGHRNRVNCLCASNMAVFSGSADCTIRVHRRKDAVCVGELTGHKATILAMCCTPEFLCSSSSDGRVMVWDVQTLAPLNGAWLFNNPVTCMMAHRGYIWGGSLREISILNPKNAQVLTSHECCDTWILSMEEVGEHVWTGGADGIIRIWLAEGGLSAFPEASFPPLWESAHTPEGLKSMNSTSYKDLFKRRASSAGVVDYRRPSMAEVMSPEMSESVVRRFQHMDKSMGELDPLIFPGSEEVAPSNQSRYSRGDVRRPNGITGLGLSEGKQFLHGRSLSKGDSPSLEGSSSSTAPPGRRIRRSLFPTGDDEEEMPASPAKPSNVPPLQLGHLHHRMFKEGASYLDRKYLDKYSDKPDPLTAGTSSSSTFRNVGSPLTANHRSLSAAVLDAPAASDMVNPTESSSPSSAHRDLPAESSALHDKKPGSETPRTPSSQLKRRSRLPTSSEDRSSGSTSNSSTSGSVSGASRPSRGGVATRGGKKPATHKTRGSTPSYMKPTATSTAVPPTSSRKPPMKASWSPSPASSAPTSSAGRSGASTPSLDSSRSSRSGGGKSARAHTVSPSPGTSSSKRSSLVSRSSPAPLPVPSGRKEVQKGTKEGAKNGSTEVGGGKTSRPQRSPATAKNSKRGESPSSTSASTPQRMVALRAIQRARAILDSEKLHVADERSRVFLQAQFVAGISSRRPRGRATTGTNVGPIVHSDQQPQHQMDTAHGLEGEQEDVASPPVDAANQENIFLVDVSSPIDGPSSAKGASHQVGSHHSNNTSINGREDEDLLVTPRQGQYSTNFFTPRSVDYETPRSSSSDLEEYSTPLPSARDVNGSLEASPVLRPFRTPPSARDKPHSPGSLHPRHGAGREQQRLVEGPLNLDEEEDEEDEVDGQDRGMEVWKEDDGEGDDAGALAAERRRYKSTEEDSSTSIRGRVNGVSSGSGGATSGVAVDVEELQAQKQRLLTEQRRLWEEQVERDRNLTSEIAQQDARISSLEERKETEVKKRGKIHDAGKGGQEEKTVLDLEVEGMDNAIQVLKEQRHMLEKERLDLQRATEEKLRDLQEQIANLELELEEAVREKERVCSEFGELSGMMEEALHQRDTVRRTLRKERQRHLREKKKLQGLLYKMVRDMEKRFAMHIEDEETLSRDLEDILSGIREADQEVWGDFAPPQPDFAAGVEEGSDASSSSSSLATPEEHRESSFLPPVCEIASRSSPTSKSAS